MIVTATEFKSNLGKYLEMVELEDIVITRNGKKIARLVDDAADKMEILRSLAGILPSDISLDEAKEERLRKYENCD